MHAYKDATVLASFNFSRLTLDESFIPDCPLMTLQGVIEEFELE